MKGDNMGTYQGKVEFEGLSQGHKCIDLSIPAIPEYVSVVRLTASVIANRIGFDFEEIEDIKVAVSEACNNVVVHSKKEDNFDIRFISESERIGITVKDNGSGFDLAEYTSPDLKNPSDHGLGIFVIKSLMDRVEVNSSKESGTEIKMYKNLL